MPTTALQIATLAFRDIGVLSQGQSISTFQSQDALVRLNTFVDSLGTQPQSMPFVARLTFALISGKGTEANPYTIGPGGDFDTPRPLRLNGAGLILNSLPEGPNTVEIPRGVFTDDGYEATQLKALQNSLPTCVYYRPTFAAGLGTIILWPVPNTAQNALALYIQQPIAQFADLSTAYYFPYGYAEMFEYNLAMRLARAYGVPLAQIPDITDAARQSLMEIKRANLKLTDLPQDPAMTGSRRGGYNINTGGTGSY
jgi:hypothetical protein